MFITARGKVMFSQASVILFTRGACMAGGMVDGVHAWQMGGVHGRWGVHGRGHAWCGWCAWQGGHMWQGGMHGVGGVHGRGDTCGRGACMAGGGGGMHGTGAGGHAWHVERPLQRAERILLECILVDNHRGHQ